MKRKQTVFLTGASGSMGFETFRILWEKRNEFDLVLLLRPSRGNKKLFKPYEKAAGAGIVSGSRVTEGEGLKIVWGDAESEEDLREACRSIDWCISTMGVISPEADRNPERAFRVNTTAVRNLVKAVEDEGPDRIKFVYIGTLAEYGDRLPPIHQARTGDPLLPSLYDMYSVSKIMGEAAVMESKIEKWVSLRQTFIMIPDLFSLMDPIMFHQPINSFMENITARDSGRAMVKCLEMDNRDDFWRKCFNLSGGPECRTTYCEFLERVYGMLGMDHRRVMDRNWLALKNFHMVFFEDAWKLNEFLNHWEGVETMEDYYSAVWEHFPSALKATGYLNKKSSLFRKLVEKSTRLQLKFLAGRKEDGTLGWIKNRNDERVEAFYGGYEAFEKIPGWNEKMPDLDHDIFFKRLRHGYDESKAVLDIDDLHEAARFRGGELLSEKWDGDMFARLKWRCAFGHEFAMQPNTVLKGGHWCLDCLGPPWRYDELTGKSEFFAQVRNVREL